MKSRLNIIPLLVFFVASGLVWSGCTKSSDKSISHDSLPEDVKPVAQAILEDSPTKFASAVQYPVERPYPLHNIEDSAQMVEYYHTLVDDSLRNKVKETPDSLWQEEGWRGWTLSNGSYLWIDNGQIYAVDYVSKRESEMLDSLSNEELETLDPHLRHGWRPVMCAIDTIDGAIFRIDNDTVQPARYRLAGYTFNTNLSSTPTIVLYGTLDTEGTMDTRFYHFADSLGNSADYSPDVVDDNNEPTMLIRRKGRKKAYKVIPGYWLDQVKRRQLKEEAEKNEARAKFGSDTTIIDSLTFE